MSFVAAAELPCPIDGPRLGILGAQTLDSLCGDRDPVDENRSTEWSDVLGSIDDEPDENRSTGAVADTPDAANRSKEEFDPLLLGGEVLVFEPDENRASPADDDRFLEGSFIPAKDVGGITFVVDGTVVSVSPISSRDTVRRCGDFLGDVAGDIDVDADGGKGERVRRVA